MNFYDQMEWMKLSMKKKEKKKQNVFPFSFHHINNYVMFHGSVILVQNINM